MNPSSSSPASSSSARHFLRTLGLVALAIGGMFAIDTFLAKTEESEMRAEGARLYAEGQKLLDSGENRQAVNRFEDAVAVERANPEYRLALARAQLAAGQVSEAENTLNSVLLANSTNGPANLTMARALVQQGKVPEAISFYHRAIYGAWPSDAGANRLPAANSLKVRFELIDLLARENSKGELLGELLAVESQAPDDVPTRLRIGNLYMEAGSPTRAAEVFGQLLKQRLPGQSPTDTAAAYAGLGEAEFAQGDYRAAADDFSGAVRLNPADQTSERRLKLCSRVLALDPSRRGLDPRERWRRSRALLDLTVSAVEGCTNPDKLEQARKLLAARMIPAREDASAESAVDLAEELWQARMPGCGSATPDDALALVLTRAAQ